MNISKSLWIKIASGIVGLGLFVGVLYLFIFSGLTKSFELVETNFSQSTKAVPHTIEEFRFTFSHQLDVESISAKTIQTQPYIAGRPVASGNVLVYILEDTLEQGETYTLTLGQDLRTVNNTSLEQVYDFTIQAGAEAKIVKITPQGDLNTLHQDITTFFSVQMVPLTNLDKRDTLPCPIEISPSVEGTCKRTTTSVVEFTPKDGFAGATDYTITVSPHDDLMYGYSAQQVEVNTPDLRVSSSSRFNPHDGIFLQFNFPVSPKTLKKHLSLTLLDDTTEKTKVRYTISTVSGSESRFILQRTQGAFQYDELYRVAISKGLMPKYGNRVMNARTKTIRSRNFVTSSNVYRNIYNSGGELVNTRTINYKYRSPTSYQSDGMQIPNLFPHKDVFMHISFAEEVPLDTSLFGFKNKDGQNVSFELAYIEEEIFDEAQDRFVIKPNKKRIKITFDDTIKTDQEYAFSINSPRLHELASTSYQKVYHTAPDFAIKKMIFKDYKNICLYTTTPIERHDRYYEEQELQNTWRDYVRILDNENNQAPIRRLQNVSKNSSHCDYQKDEGGNYLIPYKLIRRGNPYTSYTASLLPGLADSYGDVLDETESIDFKTQDITDNDKLLYLSHKYHNVIPEDAPFNLNAQTIHLDDIQMEICQMDLEGFIKFLPRYREKVGKSWQYYQNSYQKYGEELCTEHTQTSVDVVNKGRTLSNNIFNIPDTLGVGQTPSSTFDAFTYIRGTKPGYNNRFDEYGHGFEGIYIQSALSLVYEQGSNKQLLFVTDMEGKIVPNASFVAYTKNYNPEQYEKIDFKASFNDADQTYTIQEGEEFDLLVAYTPAGIGVINRNIDDFSNYDFGYVAGHSTRQDNFLYRYTDRPIYKPGDTVNFKGLMRHFEYDGYTPAKNVAGTLKIYNTNQHKNITDLEITTDTNGHFDGSFTLPEDVPLGAFQARFYQESGETISLSEYFRVEEYVKPAFKITVKNDERQKEPLIGEKISFTISPEYYFGGNLTNTKGEYDILTQKYYFDAGEYMNYQFGEGYSYYNCRYRGHCNYSDHGFYFEQTGFTIDENGEYHLSYPVPPTTGAGEKIYSFLINITDPETQKVVSKTVSRVVHITDGYVGLQNNYRSTLDQGLDINGVVLNHDAQPMNNKSVTLNIYKTERKRVKKQGVDGVFYYHYEEDKKLVKTITSKSNVQGIFKEHINLSEGGDYEIQARYTGPNDQTFVSSVCSFVSDNSFHVRNTDNNSVTDLVPDHHRRKIGETQTMTLKSPVNQGKMIVFIEKDEGILDTFVQDIDSFAPRISFPIKDTYYPNVYTKVFLIGTQENNLLPVFKRALAVTKVDTEDKKLHIGLHTDKEIYQPQQKIQLTVNVRDAQGNPVPNANGSVAIVDESVLALKGNPEKNPYAYFYDMKRYIGTQMFGSLKFLVEKLEIKNPQDGSKGGDGETAKGGDANKVRGEFRDTARWEAEFITNAQGDAILTSRELPDNLTTRDIETIVTTPEDNKIGRANIQVKSAQPVMINDNLPQFLGSDDDIVLSPVVFNHTTQDSDFVVQVKGDNITFKQSEKTVHIPAGDQATVYFEASIPNVGMMGQQRNQSAMIQFGATSQATQDADHIQKYLKIQETSFPESVGTFGRVTASGAKTTVSVDEEIDLTQIATYPGTLFIKYSATLFSSLFDGIEFLENYGYGCLEQRFSALMPNVFIKKLYDSANKDFDLTKKMITIRKNEREGYQEISLDELIKQQLAVIGEFQAPDGGLKYWKNSFSRWYQRECPNFGLTNEIIRDVGSLYTLGYEADEKVMNDALEYQKQTFYKDRHTCCRPGFCDIPEITRLDAIDARLTYNPQDYESYKMWQDIDPDDTELTRSFRIMQAQVIGKLIDIDSLDEDVKSELREQAKSIVEQIIDDELVFTPKGAFLGKSNTRSSLRTTAKFFEIIAEIGLEEFADSEHITQNMIRWIIEQKKDGHRGSTQDNLTVIKAITRYLEATNELRDMDINLDAVLNGEITDSTHFGQDNMFAMTQKDVAFQDLQQQNQFHLQAQGTGKGYYDLRLTYYLPSEKIQARDEGFSITRTSYMYQDYQKINAQKEKERIEYMQGDRGYDQLTYPKDVFAYLDPVEGGNVGDLLISRIEITTNEVRSQVAIDAPIPAGSMIINPNLDTQQQGNNAQQSSSQPSQTCHGYQCGNSSPGYSAYNYLNNGSFAWTIKEYRQHKFFGYIDRLQPGKYSFTYLYRLTHQGNFHLKPAHIFEFYEPEVFGRSAGKLTKIEQ